MRRTTLLALASGLAAPALVHAQAVLSITGGTLFSSFESDGDTAGWYFQPTSGILVTQLGFWDSTTAPFTAMTASHDVGLWNSAGTLLGSVTVDPTSAFLGDFRYELLNSPVHIDPTDTYFVGAYYPAANPLSDGYISSATSVTTSSFITHLGGTHDASGAHAALAFPSVTTPDLNGRFGPNFRFSTSDPGVSGLLGGTLFTSFEADGDTAGWYFTARSAVRVTHLGFWDNINAPFTAMTADHDVGIWDASGTLLRSITITPTSPPVGDFRYEVLSSSLLLIPGATYYVGAYYPAANPASDGYLSSTTNAVSPPEITRLGACHDPSGPVAALGFPSVVSAGVNGRYGPNFLFQTATDALIAVDSNRTLYDINIATGAKSQFGTVNSAAGVPAGLTRDPYTGTIYLSSSTTDSVYTLDLGTGNVTLVGPYGVAPVTMHGIEIDSSTGRLYGASSDNNGIYEISRVTGAATLIGTTVLASNSFVNLGYDSDTNVLYATHAGTDSLYTVNRATGHMTLIGALGGPTSPNGLAYDTANSRLYLIDNTTDSLYTINLATGAATLVGSTGVGNLLGLVYLARQAPCYANCDNSTVAPAVNTADFTCFLQKYAAGSPYANCDNSTVAPVINTADFTCFLQRYAAGCS